jgi:PH/SEC7 domain-containing protein
VLSESFDSLVSTTKSLSNSDETSSEPSIQTLAALTRNGAAPMGPRPSPPSSFLSARPPTGSNNSVNKRLSRNGMDFEQALRADGPTIHLKETPDFSILGQTDTPMASPMSQRHASISTPSSKQRVPSQPSTPIIIPATPSPVPGTSTLPNKAPAISPSPNYLARDPEEAEQQIKRRSMYRSPGTSSSPDLATLMKKARERGGLVSISSRKERRVSPPPLPRNHDDEARKRPSTSSQDIPTKSTNNGLHGDWGLTGSLSKQNTRDGTNKPLKNSVRAKTSAFLGKVLGQGGSRERSKTDARPPYFQQSPLLYDAFAPPVPPLPFQETNGVSFRPVDLAKPLPEAPTATMLDGDESLVIVNNRVLSTKTDDATIKRTKRRSMSVSEVELKNAMASSSSSTPLPPPAENSRKRDSFTIGDTSLNMILSDFQGQLSQLDPPTHSPLDLRDPSTPSRRAAMARSRTEEPSLSSIADQRTKALTIDPPEPPTFILQPPQSPSQAIPPIVPPRSSSLASPNRSPTSPHHSPSIPVSAWRRGSQYLPRKGSNVNMTSAYSSPTKESGRLRVHHSSASSSEPSLLPLHEDLRVRDRRSSVRLLPPSRMPSEDETASSKDISSASAPLVDGTILDDSSDPEAKGRVYASRCWYEDEDFLAKDKIAEWLGGQATLNKISLGFYMLNFDFSGLRLDHAFRHLCSKLYLKAETQQVDRILEQFSKVYWESNPNTLYGSAGVVHQVAYSLLLLNTDLHVAELATRMSRSQFVKNTLATLQMQNLRPRHQSSIDLNQDEDVFQSASVNDGLQTITRKTRSDSITSWNSISRDLPASSQVSVGGSARLSNGSTPSIQTFPPDNKSPIVYNRGWENDMEQLLKDMYNSIKSQQILLPTNNGMAMARTSTSSLRPGSSNQMLRNRSGRGPPDRLTTLRRGSARGLQSIMAQSGVSPYSSNSSIDGRISPSPSFATSMLEGNSTSSFLTPTLGFAFNLSTTIIRETQEDDDRSGRSSDSEASTISITDDELALLGAPWAKEGMLCRKQYWESTGKRARDKSWLDVFVVIAKGELNMFTFGDHGRDGSGAVGGGNWLANADPVGTVHLAHSLAHVLPPPGYNRQRPHCMVLTLSHGGVYFFQAGTEELVNEWVSTCNYWAARTSKEPLAGGVSNMEYGWNRVIDLDNHGRAASLNDAEPQDTLSIRSGKSTRSKFGNFSTMRATESPYSDKIYINEWKPPQPPTVSSVLDEEGQMEALHRHVTSMKQELKQHNELREAMLDLYQPRSNTAGKALSNWEKKSQYLLTEIVKYESYVESLQHAMKLRLKKRGEKALDRALSSDDGVSNTTTSGKRKADTIPEADEPITPAADQQNTSS